MSIKQLRKEKGLTQSECAEFLKIPLRSYKRYESSEYKLKNTTYGYIMDKLNSYGFVDETHGKQTIESIKRICTEVFNQYPVDYCYLFGSYSRGTETEQSDIDLLVSVPVDGLQFFELVETLRERLKKKVDLLNVSQLENNPSLMKEILKDGIKIYG